MQLTEATKFPHNASSRPPTDECRPKILVLDVPKSPLEFTLKSLANIASDRIVNIENSSVNSILLDNDPDNPYKGLLVSNVVQNQQDTVLRLRNTTLLPNIKGLTSLICMMFAPKIELRSNSHGTRYVRALCGLGANKKTKKALLPAHDLEVYFDTDFNNDTIADVSFACSFSYYL